MRARRILFCLLQATSWLRADVCCDLGHGRALGDFSGALATAFSELDRWYRMGIRQASAIDGMGRAGLDVGLSADQLVVPVDGLDQFGNRVVDSRSDLAPLREGGQKTGSPAASDVAADLPVSRPTLQCKRGSPGDLAARDLLLRAVV